MFGIEFTVCEEFEPVEPWLSWEKRWLEMYKKSLEEAKNAKRKLDCGSD